jgi:hypothetical protein
MQPEMPGRLLEREIARPAGFVAAVILCHSSTNRAEESHLIFEQGNHFQQEAVQAFEYRSILCLREQRRDLFRELLVMFAHQIHAQFALVAIPAIERSLPDAGIQGDLVHTDCFDSMFREEALRTVQYALAMLSRVAPFVPLSQAEPLWHTQRTGNLTSFFFHEFPS